MLPSPSHPYRALKEGQIDRLVLRSPKTLQILSGRLWITVEGDPYDYFLGAGRSYALRPGVLILVGAESDASYAVQPKNGPRWLARLLQAAKRMRRAGNRLLPA